METQLDHDMRVAVYDSHKKANNSIPSLETQFPVTKQSNSTNTDVRVLYSLGFSF